MGAHSGKLGTAGALYYGANSQNHTAHCTDWRQRGVAAQWRQMDDNHMRRTGRRGPLARYRSVLNQTIHDPNRNFDPVTQQALRHIYTNAPYGYQYAART
ncbi:unnamed protein product [Rotaria socialis]|uniref:Uncharacterized protein n=1 Tax=Rotaria socialis TaxID=392032 RepID=A0A818B2H8_9BILA|nr:unnamed protein product [Rotaria socialis]CAF3453191.1 unnamed protein product [Rotaria socialis]CAF3709441.1 unnamed protein product [Rotaria socialis]CAF4323970.1 unnamed protein product [Rotaria socialis]CAF4440606.1 unnamed protein product [Rotaria socialis]